MGINLPSSGTFWRSTERFWGEELAKKLEAVGTVKATLTIPLFAAGKLLGYLNLDHKENPDAFSQGDLEKLAGFSEIFAGLLDLGRKLEELRESEKLFRLLFERLADAVYITAFDGTILEANPAAEKQTGYSREELLGKNIMRDIAAEEPAITYEKANELLARGETVVFEEKKRRKDGSFYWTECAVTQFTYKGQLATLSVNRDITERKKLEAELRRRGGGAFRPKPSCHCPHFPSRAEESGADACGPSEKPKWRGVCQYPPFRRGGKCS
jgi:PAS domain S-box-containing protein